MLNKRSRKFRIFFLLFLVLFVVSAIHTALVEYQDYIDECKPTGEQRMVNSVLNAPNGALSGLSVEDKFICDGGRVTWKARYQ